MSTTSQVQPLPARPWRPPSPLRRAWSWAPWMPVVLAVVYVVFLLRSFGSLVRSIYLNADVASAPVIGQLAHLSGRGALIVLGNIPWYTALWFEELTRSVPGHRALWEITPWVLTLAGIAFLGWATSRVAGRWAGAIVAVALACAGPSLLTVQFGWSLHAVSYVHVCILGAAIVPLALSSGNWLGGRWWTHCGVLALLAVITGLGVASDSLVIVAGLVPFVIAGVLLAALSPASAAKRLGATVVGVAAGSVIVAEIARAIARGQHVYPAHFPISFTPSSELVSHVGNLIESIAWIGNGDFSGAPISGTSVLAFACFAVVLAGIVAILRGVPAWTRELRSSLLTAHRARTQTPASAGEPVSQDGHEPVRVATARTAFVWFWVSSALLLSLAFVFSTIPIGALTLRYVVTVAYALVVLLAVHAGSARRTSSRIALAAGLSILIAGSIVSVDKRIVHPNTVVSQYGPQVTGALQQFARREHVTVGYGGYWDAASLTWALDTRLTIYPVAGCGVTLCSFPYHVITSWYTPRPQTRSLFVSDPLTAALNNVGGPLASFGPPLAEAHIAQLTVYVYGYDIASKLHQ